MGLKARSQLDMLTAGERWQILWGGSLLGLVPCVTGTTVVV